MKIPKQIEKMHVLDLSDQLKLNQLFAKYLLQPASSGAANFAEKYSIKWESGSGWQFISFLAKSQISKLQIATSFASADLLLIPFTNC